MLILASVITAGAILAVLAVLLALTALAIHAEDHRARGILGTPSGHLANAARRLTGLHVRRPMPGVVQPEPAARAAALHTEGRWGC